MIFKLIPHRSLAVTSVMTLHLISLKAGLRFRGRDLDERAPHSSSFLLTPHAAGLLFHRSDTQGLGKQSDSLIGENQTSRVRCNSLLRDLSRCARANESQRSESTGAVTLSPAS